MNDSQTYSEAQLLWTMRSADAFVPAFCGLGSFLLYDPTMNFHAEGPFYVAMAASTLLSVNIFPRTGVYSVASLASIPRQLFHVLLGWTAVVGLLLLAAVAIRIESYFPQGWTIFWYASGLCGFSIVRVAVRSTVRRQAAKDRFVRKVVVIGAGPHGRRVIDYLHRPGSGFRVVAVFDDRLAARKLAEVAGVPMRGTVEDLLRYFVDQPVDQIVVALPWSGERRIADIVSRLSMLPVDVKLAAAFMLPVTNEAKIGDFNELPMLDMAEKPMSEAQLLLKRAEDVTVAAAILLLLSPILIAVSILIRLGSPGPVFFRQTRIGFNNRPISVWKFRTMYVEHCTDAITGQTLRNDSRVTPIGYWLRKFSIDELPQFLNVLQGSMSVVGPRPHALGTRAGHLLFEDAVQRYAARYRVKPGITGWAQVNGWRGETDTLEKLQHRIDHDFYYIKHWSLFFDMKIILMTIPTVLLGRNAW